MLAPTGADQGLEATSSRYVSSSSYDKETESVVYWYSI
jgi:hypothetical protein